MFSKNDYDLYEELNIRKSKSINIINLLKRREIGYLDRTETVINETKQDLHRMGNI